METFSYGTSTPVTSSNGTSTQPTGFPTMGYPN